MEIKRVTQTTMAATGAARGGAPSSFSVGTGAGPAAAPAAVAAAGLDVLLALQEWDGASGRDRRARKHGRAMLDALARLQLGLLGDDPHGPALAELAALLEQCPEAAEPGLRDALAAVSLRAQVELARRGAVSGATRP